jgi:prophage antirepressor-like protein
MEHNNDPLKDLFTSKNILIAGTAIKPLFSVPHVARYIEDQNYGRYLKDCPETHVVKMIVEGASNNRTATNFFTESGLYFYLMRRNLAKAKPFQEWVLDQLCELRLKIIDEAKLRAKIAEDTLAIVEYSAKTRIDAIIADRDYWRDIVRVQQVYDINAPDACHRGLVEHIINNIIAELGDLWRCNMTREEILELVYDGTCLNDYETTREYILEQMLDLNQI